MKLNKSQQEAVEHVNGPLLIFAGAGSGKTRVITQRMIHLIQECQVPPWSILGVTFTNKAAREMLSRVAQHSGVREQDMFVRTYHAMGLYILRQHGYHLGVRTNFSIYDQSDSESLVKAIIKDFDLNKENFPPAKILSSILEFKDQLVTANSLQATANEDKDPYMHTLSRIYRQYEERKTDNNALDFSDLLIKPLELFAYQPDVLQQYRDMWRYVMVDEYQDTNHIQYLLTKILAMEHRNLCVVGDDDQAIYSWRGADIRNILNFQKDFSEARVIKLEDNYRSTKVILDAAYSVIRNNQQRSDKRLLSNREDGEPILCAYVADDREEAAWCINRIFDLQKSGQSLDDVAILYRMHHQSRSIEEELRRRNLPYRIFGGIKFYERKEIKDTIAYLKFIVNPADELALLRIINMPPRGIGQTTMERIINAARTHSISLWEAVQTEKVTNKKIAKFCTLVDALQKKKDSIGNDYRLKRFVADVIDESGYWEMLEGESDPHKGESRQDNIAEFINSIEERENERIQGEGAPLTLEEFLQEIGLYTSDDNPDNILANQAVNLMTLHSVKGLEFSSVFIIGLDEGLFPHKYSVDAEEEGMSAEMEEERRLCYVGLTRAKDRLFLTSAAVRRLYGNYYPSSPSRFLAEIPDGLMEIDMTKNYGETAEREYLSTIRKKSFYPNDDFYNSNYSNNGSNKTKSGSNFINPAKKKSSTQTGQKYKIGMQVRHDTYGIGSITDIEKKSGLVVLYISFNGRKPLTLLEQYSKLEIIR